MIGDGEDYKGQTLKTAVCIVGSGPAGVTLAWYLQKQGISVVLLEGSRLFNRPPATSFGDKSTPYKNTYDWNENATLYAGETAGLMQANEDNFPILPAQNVDSNAWERERLYGGTSTHWGGQSRPLDPIVFEKREGFPGWPITRADLDPYYAEASTFCGLYGPYYGPQGQPAYNFTAEFWSQELGMAIPALPGFDFGMYQFWNDRQFQARKLDGQHTIDQMPNVQVITNASLLNIAQEGSKVTTLTVGVLDGTREVPVWNGTFQVQADAVVLACGAVENARRLLLSGFGEDNDNVGAYFMGHPIAIKNPITAVYTAPLFPSPNLIGYQNRSIGNLFAIEGTFTPTREMATELAIGSAWFFNNGTGNYYHELLPFKESRVKLAPDAVDVFEQQQCLVDWRLNPRSEENYKLQTQLFTQGVQQIKPGQKVTVADFATLERAMMINGHHIGTARMADSAENGVVDKNLKVFGTDNLFVAGSAVWATAGIPNPTFSIITFSIRLAEHLGKSL